ncbi:MAG: ABC transporter permease [Candidatus Aminicenantes bacterium]|nr:ABC transporter permease [Candidatus Aminicenantes bacterium]
MKKFTHLLKKEIRELVTKQLVISLLFTMALFYFIGGITKQEMRKSSGTQKISVLDLDKSDLSRSLLGALTAARFEVVPVQAADSAVAVEAGRKSEANVLVVIPAGFGESVARLDPLKIETYAYLRNFSITGIRRAEILKAVLGAMNEYLSNNFLKERLPGLDPAAVKNPIKTRDFVLIRDRMAEGTASSISGIVMSQSMLIPIILMMIIIYSSQMVISAIAMEKQDKTLETLLTVPISRTSIVAAKMLAAGIVGLISAVIYMLGYKSLMSGFTGDLPVSAGAQSVAAKLGLTLTGSGLIVLGLALFLAILCALAMATILGVLAEDFRSAQSLIMPVILMVMIPYFLTMFADVKTLSLPAKILLLAIPFSHSFMAVQNMFLGDMKAVLFGMLYMLAFFGVLVYLAGRIFSSDKVLTMKLSWKKKKKPSY